jgi:hypothetical protein
MDINSAINVIDGSDRTPDEKNHLKRLVYAGKLVPNAFDGIPNYDQILEVFPIEGIYIYILFFLLYLILNFLLYICFCNYEYLVLLIHIMTGMIYLLSVSSSPS